VGERLYSSQEKEAPQGTKNGRSQNLEKKRTEPFSTRGNSLPRSRHVSSRKKERVGFQKFSLTEAKALGRGRRSQNGGGRREEKEIGVIFPGEEELIFKEKVWENSTGNIRKRRRGKDGAAVLSPG